VLESPHRSGLERNPATANLSWPQPNGFKIWVGEIGWTSDPTGTPDATTLMSLFHRKRANPCGVGILGW
jgi:hypothetical protein